METSKRRNVKTSKRRGFTLLEMLIASTCMLAIATAGTTMALAVSYAMENAPQTAAATVTGHGALNRVAKIVRKARLVGFYDASQAALWTGDPNSDDKPQLSETAVLWLDSSSQEIKYTKPFPDDMPAATVALSDRAVSMSELASSAYPNTVRQSANAATAVVVPATAGLEIRGNATSTDANMLDLRVKLSTPAGSLAFVASAAPRAPADYLVTPARNTNDGVATKRPRRTAMRSWTVPP